MLLLSSVVTFPIAEIVNKAVGIVGEYEKANMLLPSEINRNTPIIHVWSPPSARVYKINSDAACFNDKSTSLGGVMRDQTGDIMAATCWLVQGCFDIDIAEALAATHALLIAMEAGLKRVILEVDNLKLFKHLSKGSYDSSCFGLVVKDIVYLACLCLSCSFSHVGRNGNRVAHILANCGRAFDEMRLIVNFFFPFFVLNHYSFNSLSNQQGRL